MTAPCIVARAGPGRPSPSGGGGAQPLIATSDRSARASVMTAAIGRAHGRRLVQLHVGGADVDVRHRLVSETADAYRLRGTEPVIEIRTGAAHHAITELARRRGAALLVLASRGISGIRALRSVSERVAREAPCSVLDVRGLD